MLQRCLECGDVRPLNRDGVCTFRGGCEHRIAVHDGAVRRLLAEMAKLDPLPCGHTPADHQAMADIIAGSDADLWAAMRRHSIAMEQRYLEQLREAGDPVAYDWENMPLDDLGDDPLL